MGSIIYLRRAGIVDLQYRDLRHEAGRRFDEADLSRAEIKMLLGRDKSSPESAPHYLRNNGVIVGDMHNLGKAKTVLASRTRYSQTSLRSIADALEISVQRIKPSTDGLMAIVEKHGYIDDEFSSGV